MSYVLRGFLIESLFLKSTVCSLTLLTHHEAIKLLSLDFNNKR